MAIFDLFSKRQKRLTGNVPDIFIYDQMPIKLRVQISHIISDTISDEHFRDTEKTFLQLRDILCREYGRFDLGRVHYNESYRYEFLNFFQQTEEVNEALDVVELSFRYIETLEEENYWIYQNSGRDLIRPTEAIQDLNERFKENGIGYRFEASQIVKIDSTYIHTEVVKPTLLLLSNRKFTGANEEYLKAHEHYKEGRNKECLTDCLKALESTMKVICKEKGWSFDQTDTAKKLIQICFDNNLVPTFTQNQFTALRNIIESGIPTIRNKLGGHGQGQIPQKVDDGMVRYALNLTGANIIFLIEQSGIQ